ncbi:GPN2, partial [Symbiodinium sp. CCMP2592]
MLSLSAMMQLELPHINVLSKIDMVMDHTDDLTFSLDYYAGVSDLSQLLWTLQTNKHPLSTKFKAFNRLLAELIEDYGLVSFEPLDIEDKECALRVLGRCDTANGHVMNAEKVE